MINDKQNVGIIVNAEILENLKRLAQKAVPGPWSVDSLGNIFREPHAIDEDWQPIVLLTKSSLGEYAPAEANAAYIAALSPDVALALVDEIERLNKEIKSLREIENGKLWISVMDNGLGMARHVLERVRGLLENKTVEEQGRHQRSGMGLKNVHDRIRLICGEEYGIELTSYEGIGTIVKYCLPVIGEEEPDLTKGEKGNVQSDTGR